REGRARCEARRERWRDPGGARRRVVPLFHPHADAARDPALRGRSEGNAMTTRRDFLKTGSALVVSFGAGALLPRAVTAAPAGPFDTRPSHIDGGALDAWLAVGADGRVTAYTGKCDFGQGIFTAQVQLVAEELDVPIARVTMIECDTAVTPDQGTT